MALARSARPRMAFSATSNAPLSSRTSGRRRTRRRVAPDARSLGRVGGRRSAATAPRARPTIDGPPGERHLARTPPGASRRASPCASSTSSAVPDARRDEAAEHARAAPRPGPRTAARASARRGRRAVRSCRGWGRRGTPGSAPRRARRSACTTRAARPCSSTIGRMYSTASPVIPSPDAQAHLADGGVGEARRCRASRARSCLPRAGRASTRRPRG